MSTSLGVKSRPLELREKPILLIHDTQELISLLEVLLLQEEYQYRMEIEILLDTLSITAETRLH